MNNKTSHCLNLSCPVCKKEFKRYSSNIKSEIVTCSRKCQGYVFKKTRLGDGNPMWKGDRIGYVGIHDYVKWHLRKPTLCQRCGVAKRLDLANISQKYKRDLNDWEWLCRSCHMIKDGRLSKLYYNRWVRNR